MNDPVATYIAEQFHVADQSQWEEVTAKVQEALLNETSSYVPHAEIDQLLDHLDDHSKTLFVVHDHERIDVSNFQSRNAFREYLQAHPEASVVFSQMQRFSPWLKSLCDYIETETGLSSFATAFHTPPAQQAFSGHWDIVSVVALQLEGQKQWWLWPPVAKSVAEIYSQRRVIPTELGSEALTVVLNPGDALFIPRGWLHHARTSGNAPSFHVSIAVCHSDIRHYQMTGHI